MSTIKRLPSPLFDGLKQLLANEAYQPKLSGTGLQDYEQAKNFDSTVTAVVHNSPLFTAYNRYPDTSICAL